jgi:hypothetical protein
VPSGDAGGGEERQEARQEARPRQLRAQDQDATEDAAELITTHGAVSKTVAHLLGYLRATPRSRTVPRAAGARPERVSESPPWEIRANPDA